MTVRSLMCADPKLIYLVLPAWTVLWACIGYWAGARGRPKRYVLIEDSGAWTAAKLHHVDAHDDDAPTGLEESLPPEKSKQG